LKAETHPFQSLERRFFKTGIKRMAGSGYLFLKAPQRIGDFG